MSACTTMSTDGPQPPDGGEAADVRPDAPDAGVDAVEASADVADVDAAAPTITPGVFALLAADETNPDPSLYTNGAIAGLAVRTAWATLEPAEGQYDWSYLDAQVKAAKLAGKKISIAFAAASAKRPAPSWVFAKGAQSLDVMDGKGIVYPIPVPWDVTFLDAWTSFIAAAGTRYANEPTVAYVRGATESVTNGWALPGTDANGKSLSTYGYTAAKEVAALERVVDAMMAAFPHTVQWDEVGIVKDTVNLAVTTGYFADTIATYGFAHYAGRFGVWREDLSACTPNPPTREDWTILAAHPGLDGAQMVWNVQDGPAFRMDQCEMPTPDKGTVLRDAIEKGIALGMPYVEVYEIDCTDSDPGVIATLKFASTALKVP